MFKARFLSLGVTVAPYALAILALAIGTKTGGMSDGGFKLA